MIHIKLSSFNLMVTLLVLPLSRLLLKEFPFTRSLSVNPVLLLMPPIPDTLLLDHLPPWPVKDIPILVGMVVS